MLWPAYAGAIQAWIPGLQAGGWRLEAGEDSCVLTERTGLSPAGGGNQPSDLAKGARLDIFPGVHWSLAWQASTLAPHYCATLIVWRHCGTVVLWYCGTVVLWYCGTVVLWYCGTMVLWYCGTVVLWYCGTVVMWYL